MKPSLLAIAIAVAASHPAHAESDTDAGHQKTDIIVTGARAAAYSPSSASSAIRLDTPLIETPATVQVIDKTLLADRAITQPRELAETVSGIQSVAGYGNTPSQWYVIRGFSTAGVNYRDGYRVAELYTPRDFANVDRVEFVKGPQSVLYGQAQPSGAVNTVTKVPVAEAVTRVDLSGGSFDTYRGALDFNRDLGAVAVRLNVMGQSAGSYVNFESSDTVLIAPSIRVTPMEGVSLLYSAEYQKTKIKGFSNGLPFARGVFDLPASATVSQPWARLNNETFANRVELAIALGGGWQFKQGFYTSKTDRDYQGVSPAFNQFDGTPLADYPVMYNAGPQDDQFNQALRSELSGTLRTGPLTHTLLAGYEHFRSRFNYGFYDQFGCDDVGNCFGGYTRTFSTGIPFPSGGFTGGFFDSSGTKTDAVYLNDQIALGNLRILGGVRHDWSTTEASGESARKAVTTGHFGLLYRITPAISVYYSWGQSFVPNFGRKLGGGTLEPERGRQHEIGLKFAPKPGLDITVAGYDIVKSNVRFLASATEYLTSGRQASRGIEATVAGAVTKQLQVIANYAYIDRAEITADNNPARIGNRFYGVPRHSFNAWGRYDLPLALPGNLAIGAGVAAIGRRAADNDRSGFDLPGYTRLDAALFYSVKGIDFAVNVRNLNDAAIFDTVDGYFVQRQAPRSVTASARFAF
jgi:iron complex outermembrane receptor protein